MRTAMTPWKIGTVKLLFIVLFLTTSVPAKDVQLTAQSKTGSIAFGGLTRTYAAYVPPSLTSSSKPALVLILHGGLGTGAGMQKLTLHRFNELADRDGFIALYPDGIGKSWNDGRMIDGDRAHKEQLDDVGFLSALIEQFEKQYGVDQHRVYVTGISNGAMMAFRLACDLSEKIAAAAPVAGSLPKVLAGTCRSKEPVSILAINGDEDPLVPFKGGQVHFFGRKRGEIIPVTEAAAFWGKRDGCGPIPRDETLPDRDPKDHTSVEKFSFPPSPQGHEVVLYVIHGGGHTWPMGWKYAGEWLVGRVSRELDACDLIWDFFKAHPKK